MTRPGKNDVLSRMVGMKHVEDWRSVGIVLFTVCSLATHWRTYTPDQSWSVWFAWWLFNSTFCWFCATIVHNSIHVPPFRRQVLNDLWQLLLVSTYGYAVSVLIPGHNLSHHKYTQSAKDVMRTDQMRYSWHFINLIMFFPSVFFRVYEQDNNYMMEMGKQGAPIFYQTARELIWFISYTVFLTHLNWQKYFWCILLPQAVAKWGIVTINMFQHDGLPTPEEDRYNFSRNFVDPTLNFFTCNNGYHTAHHNNPGTHWSKYKHIHETKIKPNMNPNLDEPSLIWTFVKMFLLPGGRTDKDGKPYKLPPPVEDVAWFKPGMTYETYSDGTK